MGNVHVLASILAIMAWYFNTYGPDTMFQVLSCVCRQSAQAEADAHIQPAHYEINENAPWDSVTAKPILTSVPPSYLQANQGRRVLADGTRDNEYASMRLLSTFADLCDHENNENTTKIHTRTYESPQYGRARTCGLDTFGPVVDNGIPSDTYGIPYFDELEAGHTISRQGNPGGVAARGTKVRLVADRRGSREVKCSIMADSGKIGTVSTCPHGHTSIEREDQDAPRTFVCHPGSHPGKVSV